MNYLWILESDANRSPNLGNICTMISLWSTLTLTLANSHNIVATLRTFALLLVTKHHV